MHRFHTVLAVILILIGSATFSSAYWVSFTTDETIFVMKITDNGEVLVPPTVIDTTLDSFMTTLTPDGQRLAVWATVTGNSGVEGPVYRIIVDTATLQASAITQFAVGALREKSFYSLSSSQDPNNIFLVLQKKKLILKGAGVNQKEKWDGRVFRVSPRTDGNSHGGAASDGRMAWSISPTFVDGVLYLQPLKADGIPTGDPAVAGASPGGEFLAYADVSNPLPGGKRFVVYNSVTTGFPEVGSVYLQPVDASTGQKMGQSKLLASGFGAEFSFYASVTIDPDGDFVLYSAGDASCPTQYLVFQKLDASGNASGAPFTIVDCDIDPPSHTGVIGVDILKE